MCILNQAGHVADAAAASVAVMCSLQKFPFLQPLLVSRGASSLCDHTVSTGKQSRVREIPKQVVRVGRGHIPEPKVRSATLQTFAIAAVASKPQAKRGPLTHGTVLCIFDWR